MKEKVWMKLLRRSHYRDVAVEESNEIINGITNGVDIEFIGNREISRTCSNLPSATENDHTRSQVSAVIAADVAAGKKAGPFDSPPFDYFTCSPVGAVPKRGSTKVRVINHLSYPVGGDSINESIVEKDQRLGSFDEAMRAVRKLGPGCMLVKLDVEAAYKQVPVRAEDWPLLGFRWEGKYYYERCLPFGLKSSCRKWELYATAMHHFFVHYLNIALVVHYIDDFLFVIDTKSTAQEQLSSALTLCIELGIPMSSSKTEGPTTQLTFLGIQIDTINMVASLSEDRLGEVQSLLDDWDNREVASKKELQSLTGVLQWCSQVVRPGRSYLRRIIEHTTTLKSDRSQRTIPSSVFDDIRWWRSFINQWNGTSIIREDQWTDAATIELYTDACESGYGGMFGREWIEGRWDEHQLTIATNTKKKKLSMPYLELLALTLAIATWSSSWQGKRITLRSDCMPVVHSINRRSSRIPRSMALIRHIATMAALNDFDLQCVHVKGTDNIAADTLSRNAMMLFFDNQPNANRQRTVTALLPTMDRM